MTASLPEVSTVDAIIALVAVEGVVLAAWRARTGRGPPIAGSVVNLSSGAALLFALRAALSGAPYGTVLIFLSVALIAHVVDLAKRWEASSSRSPPLPKSQPSLTSESQGA